MCEFSGQTSHPRDKCPAKDWKCNNCCTFGHFATKCRKPKDKNKAKMAEVTGESNGAVYTLHAEIAEVQDNDDL